MPGFCADDQHFGANGGVDGFAGATHERSMTAAPARRWQVGTIDQDITTSKRRTQWSARASSPVGSARRRLVSCIDDALHAASG